MLTLLATQPVRWSYLFLAESLTTGTKMVSAVSQSLKFSLRWNNVCSNNELHYTNSHLVLPSALLHFGRLCWGGGGLIFLLPLLFLILFGLMAVVRPAKGTLAPPTELECYLTKINGKKIFFKKLLSNKSILLITTPVTYRPAAVAFQWGLPK